MTHTSDIPIFSWMTPNMISNRALGKPLVLLHTSDLSARMVCLSLIT